MKVPSLQKFTFLPSFPYSCSGYWWFSGRPRALDRFGFFVIFCSLHCIYALGNEIHISLIAFVSFVSCNWWLFDCFSCFHDLVASFFSFFCRSKLWSCLRLCFDSRVNDGYPHCCHFHFFCDYTFISFLCSLWFCLVTVVGLWFWIACDFSKQTSPIAGLSSYSHQQSLPITPQISPSLSQNPNLISSVI